MFRFFYAEEAYYPPSSLFFRHPKEYLGTYNSARLMSKIQKKMKNMNKEYHQLEDELKKIKALNEEYEKQSRIRESFLYGIDKEAV